jgi:outer membrane protein assembly factor BamA
VSELPLILEVTFKGLESARLEASEIVQALRANRVKLAKGEVCDEEKVRAALRVIENLLAARRRENIRVEARQKVESPQDVSIEFSFVSTGQ